MIATRGQAPQGTRDRVIAAATRLFAERGFDATPIQAIADEVGLTKPALLHHFPSKEHLRQEVMSSILAYWSERLPRLLLAATSSEDRFDTVFGEVYRFFAAEPERARLIAREALDRPEEARELLRGVLPVVEAIAGYIRSGQAHNRHYQDADVTAYVMHVLQFIIGAVALSDVISPALGVREAGRARYDRELARIAKASLFSPQSGTQQALPAKRDRSRRRA
jgi:AcrR family transcriptional regulator